MPTHVVVQTAYDQDTALPRDRVVFNPCFRWANLTIQDAESLAMNVLAAFVAAFPSHTSTHVIAKVYDLEGSKPVLPMAEVEQGIGLLTGSNIPREVSMCLSFKGGPGAPRNRGRLYIPAWWADAGMASRPSDAVLTKVLSLAQHLYDVGGANVDWIVWSRVARAATSVTSAWVDDEWDTQRRRGFKPTKRLTDEF